MTASPPMRPRLESDVAVIRGRDRRTGRLVSRRMLQIPLVLLVVSVLVFWLVQVVPGDPGRSALGPYATAEQVHAWNVAHGLVGDPFQRYLSWLGGFVTGDWGTSIVYAQPVAELVLGRLANSIALGLFAFAILVPVAVGIAAFQARAEGSFGDRAATASLMTLASVPEFVVGIVLLIVFALVFPILPLRADEGTGGVPALHAMILPALTLALGAVAAVARTARAGIIHVTQSPFHRTAVVKGLGRPARFTRHVARNALIPTIALLGVTLGAFVGGSAVVETLFAYPGLGELLVTATQRKDVFVLAAGVMVTGSLALIALLVTDIAFTVVDPRVRFGAAT